MKIRKLLPLVALVASTPNVARAEERAECAKAYEQTQRARQEGAIVRALDDADRCAQPSCPELLRNECGTWAKDLRASVARIVIRVRGGDGCTAEQASLVTSPHARREGEGWVVDPGAQELGVVDPSSTQTKKVQFDLRPGERREIDVDFAAPNATCTKGTPSTPATGEGTMRRIPLLSVGLGSLGLGFVVLGGTLGIIGAGKRSDLDACKPNCSEDRIDAVRPYLVIGDTVAVVGLVAIGAAIAVYFMGPNAPVKASASGVAVTF